MLVIQAFRDDRLLAVASQFVVAVFGEVFQQQAEAELDLGNVVATEVDSLLVFAACKICLVYYFIRASFHMCEYCSVALTL